MFKHIKTSYLYIFLLCIHHFAHTNIAGFIDEEEIINLRQEENDDEKNRSILSQDDLLELRAINQKKPTTIVIYIAADNDLHPYAWKNIKQMENIGSNDNINIIVQINSPGSLNGTKRYIIKNNKRLLVPAEEFQSNQKLNSGHPDTLIDCVAWAMEHYPADNLILNLWDHGSGVYDPGMARAVNSLDLFRMNIETNELELNRTIGYSELMNPLQEDIFLSNKNEINTFYNQKFKEETDYKIRGICFDESFKSYMTNQDLKYALYKIQNEVLQGKKIGVIWFDACLMSMVEIANICKDHVDYFVGSQEVEFASGSNYELALTPFINGNLNSREFACHVVSSYKRAYQFITRDYTQSAIELARLTELEANIHLVANQLLLAIENQYNNSVIKMLQLSKARHCCTCFQEPSYIDLRDFYINLQRNLQLMILIDQTKEATIRFNLLRLLDQGINIINATVVANETGSNLQRACGLSIYFPERGMFTSYPKCSFAQINSWTILLAQYLLAKK